MMRKKKHTGWWIVGIVVVILVAAGLSVGANGGFTRNDEITVGTIGPDVQVWQHIANSKQAKDEGLKIKVKSFTDPVALNRATASGEIDVNAFQSWSYLQAYNKENKKAQLAAIGTTYLEPMGLYSDKYKILGDQTANSAVRNFVVNKNYGIGNGNEITLWAFYNLLTEANKNAYIDRFLAKSVNATDFSFGIAEALQGKDTPYKWFIQ